jgi:hypothetical protein
MLLKIILQTQTSEKIYEVNLQTGNTKGAKEIACDFSKIFYQ